jgi:hypothetical protein
MFIQRSTRQRSEALPPIVGTPVPTLFPNFYVINKLRRLSAFRIARIGGDASPPIPATLSNDPTGCGHPFRPDLVHAYRSWSFPRWHGPATPAPCGCHNRLPGDAWQKHAGKYAASQVSSVWLGEPPHAPLSGSLSHEGDADALVRRAGPCRAGSRGTHIARPILGRRWGTCALERTAAKPGRTRRRNPAHEVVAL